MWRISVLPKKKPDPQEKAKNKELDVDGLIDQLLTYDASAHKGKMISFKENDLRQLCVRVRQIFMNESVLLNIEAPFNICGDIHGQFSDLVRIFKKCGRPPDVPYLFLGDYVDRGPNSLETITLLFAMKLKWPDKVYMLRGNHESSAVNRVYGFFHECKRRSTVRVWKAFGEAFNWMPVAAVISKRIFCCHGGLSPELSRLEDITQFIERPTEIRESGLLCDLLWSDPEPGVEGWQPNDRGVSYVFGEQKVKRFLHANHLDLICRAHQVVEDGYEFFAGRGLVTVFSASNYCGEFDNAGGVMLVDRDLVCSFAIIEPLVSLLKPAKNTKA